MTRKHAMALLVLCTALRVISLVRPCLSDDEATYCVVGREMLHGQALYRDVVDHKPPLIYVVNEVCQAIGGPVGGMALLHALLILVVLLQSGRGGGMGSAFGGASSQIFGGRGAGGFLARVTTASAIIFMATALTLSMFASHQRSVKEGAEAKKPAAQTETTGEQAAPAAGAGEQAAPAPAAGEQPAPSAPAPAHAPAEQPAK